MIMFFLGFACGWFIHRFKFNIVNLWKRTETKIEKVLDEK